jgi:hypothetical protein
MTDFESLYNQPNHAECRGCYVGKSAIDSMLEIDFEKVSPASLVKARDIIVGAINQFDDVLLQAGRITPEQIAADNQDLLEKVNTVRIARGLGALDTL